jgi:hypothetical protein
MQCSLASCHFLPLRSEYSPQYSVLTYSQSMLPPLCEKPSSTPIKTSKIMVLYILMLKFLQRRQEDKRLNRKVESIPQI